MKFVILVILLTQVSFADSGIDVTGKFYPFYQSGFSKNLTSVGIGAELRVAQKRSSQWSWQLEGFGEGDSGPSKESYAELSNAFLEWHPDTTQVRIGWQSIHWEGTDILNLADVVNAKNYLRPLNPVPRSSPTIRISREFETWDFDLIYIPKKASHLYPSNKSYWLPRNRKIVLENQNTEVVVPNDIDYELKENEVLNSADINNVGARVNYRGLFDFNLFFFEGANISGTLILDGVPLEISPATVIQLTSPVRITPLEYRQRVYGGVMTKTFWDSWILRLSASNTKPLGLDERLPSPQDSFVVSLEHTTEVMRKSVILSLGAYEVRKLDTNQLALLRSVFSKAYSFSGRLEWSEETSILWAYVYDSIGKSSLTHVEWDHRLSGRWSLGYSFDLFDGNKETLLGSYRDYDLYRGLIKYSF